MTPEQFCYWLQGFAEITGANVGFGSNPQPHEWEVIKDHLNLVFKKETPDYNVKVVPDCHKPAKTSKEIQEDFDRYAKQLKTDPWPHWSLTGPVITC